MAKFKPHKGLLKRVKLTATGKVVRRSGFKGHLMSTKSGSRRRRLSRPVVVAGAFHDKIRNAIRR